MKSTFKLTLLMFAFLPVLFTGCDSLFDKGDVEKVYDGPSVVEFFPLSRTVTISTTPTTSIGVQLIGPQRSADLSVAYTVDATSTAIAGTHYNITTPSPVTLAANTSSVPVTISLIAGSVPAGQERRLILNLVGADGVAPAENLKRATIFIRP